MSDVPDMLDPADTADQVAKAMTVVCQAAGVLAVLLAGDLTTAGMGMQILADSGGHKAIVDSLAILTIGLDGE